jgi:abhydrolase domain-containing protein 17
MAWLFPNRLIFRPPPPSYKADDEIIKLQTEDGSYIAAKLYRNADAKFTILFSHGNAEDIGYIQPFAKQLRESGFAVFTYDYRGYGLSDGEPTEGNAYRDIRAAYRHLVEVERVPANRIILHGRSLGGAVAVDLAAQEPVGGLIVESTFTSVARVLTGFRIFPFDMFNSLSKIKSVHCPVLVIHGKLDKTISFAHGEKLFATANEPKTHFWVEDAGHNDLFSKARTAYLPKIVEFSTTLNCCE